MVAFLLLVMSVVVPDALIAMARSAQTLVGRCVDPPRFHHNGQALSFNHLMPVKLIE
jgi:hypothetical protein